jgi:hypothetical protein
VDVEENTLFLVGLMMKQEWKCILILGFDNLLFVILYQYVAIVALMVICGQCNSAVDVEKTMLRFFSSCSLVVHFFVMETTAVNRKTDIFHFFAYMW